MFEKMRCGWHSIWPWIRMAGEEKQKGGQKENLAPIMNHNNHNCEPFIEYYVVQRFH